MKAELQQQAKNFYFETDLTKTEIAAQLGVNRRTIMLWCHEGNWDQLKNSARCLPAILAEKCYYLVNNLLDDMLTPNSGRTLNLKEADTLNKMASSIRKLKNRSTANEAMEMFNFFLEFLRRQNASLAAEIRPYMEKYFQGRKDVQVSDHLLEEFNTEGRKPISHKEIEDKLLDGDDACALEKEIEKTGDYDQALENWQNAPAA